MAKTDDKNSPVKILKPGDSDYNKAAQSFDPALHKDVVTRRKNLPELQFLLDKHCIGIEQIPLAELHIDRSYQRRLSPSKMQLISRQFDIRAVGTILVSLRNDDTYYIIDGQHRVEVMRQLGIQKCLCQVLYDLDIGEEAKLWYECNTARGMPSTIDRFRARLRAGEPVAVTIYRILTSEGFTIDFEKKKHTTSLSCVGAIEVVYWGYRDMGKRPKEPKTYEDVLRATLKTIKIAYLNDQDGKSGVMVAALGLFWKYYLHEDVTPGSLARKLSPYPAIKLIGDAKASMRAMTGNAPTTLAVILLNMFNSHKKEKLPYRFPKTIGSELGMS